MHFNCPLSLCLMYSQERERERERGRERERATEEEGAQEALMLSSDE